ncbi:hypothetical protein ACWHAO_23900 [Streptomyces albidoflavus]
MALLAEPDAPAEIAQHMARILPDRLAERSGEGKRFEVKAVREPLTAGTEGPSTLMHRMVERKSAENWDIIVALTDLPLHAQGRMLAVEVSHEHGVALLCLPTLGALRLRRRAQQVVEERTQPGEYADRQDWKFPVWAAAYQALWRTPLARS